MEVIPIIVGFLLAFLVWYIWQCVKNAPVPQIVIDDPTNDAEFHKLQNTPHCPFCGSYDIKLINDNANVPWLKGKIGELDHYQCQHCFETFQDENWQDTVVYKDHTREDD